MPARTWQSGIVRSLHPSLARTCAAALALALAVAGCDAGGPTGPAIAIPAAGDVAALIISDPVSGRAAGHVAAVGPGLATNLGNTDPIVYVAAASGLVPGAVAAEVENERTGATLRLAVIEGGFDPVPFEAVAGDTLAVKFALGDGGSTLLRAAVPARRRPRVVRTQPARGRTDVAINSVIRTVFSEPVDPASLTDSTVRLLQGGVALPGTVRATAGTALEAEFVPAAPLAPGTGYRIVLSGEIRDLSGDPLEVPEPIDFTTFATPGTGTVTVTAVTSGPEAGGYLVRLDGAPDVPLDANGTLTLNVSAGAHWIWLAGVEDNCTVDSRYRPFTVTDGAAISIEFTADCLWLPTLRLTTATTGEELDPDGYEVVVNDVAMGRVPANGSSSVPLELGSAIVRLTGVSVNCSEPDPAYLAIALSTDAEIQVERTITCTRPFQPTGMIAFSGRDTVAGETRGAVFVANADGTARVRITDGSELDMDPSWSPDGARIVFAREIQPGVSELHVVNADGSNPVKLTEAAMAYEPSWSPDGRRIAFVSWRGGAAEIQVMDLDGGPGAPVRISPPGDGQYYSPAWSPSGTEVAFVGHVPGRNVTDLFVVAADGGAVRRHEYVPATGSGADGNADYANPAWLPDGTAIAVNRCVYSTWGYGCDAWGWEYFVVHPDGREVELLGQALAGGAWSPDGTIAFQAHDGIRFIRADGQRAAVVIENAANPAWRP
jgi:Tol biopolymer transport system component